ncbi:isopenicillin N synthase family oxygenase [Acetobacter senegalensis]|nr:isopenicillin N synthase family oxygenase [Acetobacter senegalensis]
MKVARSYLETNLLSKHHMLGPTMQQKNSVAEIPVLDVSALRGTCTHDLRGVTIEKLRHTLETVGFIYLSNHGIDDELVERMRDAVVRFHDLPQEAKDRLLINRFHRGYIPARSSTLRTSSVAEVTRPNRSDSLMIMHELAQADPAFLRGDPLQGANCWPEEFPELRTIALDYMAALSALGRDMAVALAEALGLLPTWFLPHFDRPTLFLRLLHYPHQGPVTEDAGIGAAPHTDYGFITILAQDNSGGLEVQAKNGDWIPAPPIPGTFVMNVGDILSRWSNGRFASTPHRVINRSGNRRFSQPFFFDPSMDSVIECPSSLLQAGETPRMPPVRWGDYLMERLDRNYNYRNSPSQ